MTAATDTAAGTTAAGTAAPVDLVALRAKLRAKQAAAKSMEGRLQALEQGLEKARDQQRGIRSQLHDAESGLQEARRTEPSRRVYAFLGDTAEVDLLSTDEAEVERLRGEVEKLEGIERSIADELRWAQGELRILRSNVSKAMAELILVSPEYNDLVAAHRRQWQKLRSIKEALRLVVHACGGHASKSMHDEPHLSEPLEIRVGFGIDEELVGPWRSALEDLSTNADTLLPQSDAAAPSNGHALTRPGNGNGNHHLRAK